MKFFDVFSSSSPVILAPMAGITSLPYRMLNRQFGCNFTFLEMINVRSLCYWTKKTRELLTSQSEDRPLGIQLLGSDSDYVLKGLEKIDMSAFDVLDFNAACPQKKVTNRGEGASLLRDPKKMCQLLGLLIKNSPLPVTLKMRLGWNNSLSAVDIALAAQDAGVKAVFVHGRTAFQQYSGTVDYDAIRKIKKALAIKVVGSGNIFNGQLAKKMFDETGCDGITVARGALGNPWIFNEIKRTLKNEGDVIRPSLAEVSQTAKDHFTRFIEYYGEERGIRRFSKFFIWYTNGFSNVKYLRAKAQKTRTKNGMLDLIDEFACCGTVLQ